jgi:hypothetical protein
MSKWLRLGILEEKLLFIYLFFLKLNLTLHALYFKCVRLHLDIVLLQCDFRSIIH